VPARQGSGPGADLLSALRFAAMPVPIARGSAYRALASARPPSIEQQVPVIQPA